MNRAVVTGAGGFIGYHLVEELKRRDWYVRGVDIKEPEFAPSSADEFWLLDLRSACYASKAVSSIGPRQLVDVVFGLAANMGGMGYILSDHETDIFSDNIRINLNTIRAAAHWGVKRYFFSSSVCVYPIHKQMYEFGDMYLPGVPCLNESSAIPANPMGLYGWEKLAFEQVCEHFHSEGGMQVRIARFHNTYGPCGTWYGGKEKAPAAICRKIAVAKLLGYPEIEIWGDGMQSRTFTYIDDVVDGIIELTLHDYPKPVNIGSEKHISINHMAHIIAHAAGIDVELVHVPGVEGVRHRRFDNSLSKRILWGWEPKVSLTDGLRTTYEWIESEVRGMLNSDPSAATWLARGIPPEGNGT